MPAMNKDIIENGFDNSTELVIYIKPVRRPLRDMHLQHKYFRDYVEPEAYLDFFSRMPERNWGVKIMCRRNEMMDCQGFLGEYLHKYNSVSKYFQVLIETFIGEDVTYINDGFSDVYTQGTPKKRIIKAIKDIIDMRKSGKIMNKDLERVWIYTKDLVSAQGDSVYNSCEENQD